MEKKLVIGVFRIKQQEWQEEWQGVEEKGGIPHSSSRRLKQMATFITPIIQRIW